MGYKYKLINFKSKKYEIVLIEILDTTAAIWINVILTGRLTILQLFLMNNETWWLEKKITRYRPVGCFQQSQISTFNSGVFAVDIFLV